MKEIILVSHGEFCIGLKNSIEMILGPQATVHTVSLYEEEGEADFLEKFEQVVANMAGNYVVFADLLGGTPCNILAKKIMGGQEIELYAGMNMPMIIAYLNAQMIDVPFDLEGTRESIVDVVAHIRSFEDDDE